MGYYPGPRNCERDAPETSTVSAFADAKIIQVHFPLEPQEVTFAGLIGLMAPFSFQPLPCECHDNCYYKLQRRSNRTLSTHGTHVRMHQAFKSASQLIGRAGVVVRSAVLVQAVLALENDSHIRRVPVFMSSPINS